MDMSSFLYLTTEEQEEFFANLPQDIQKKWATLVRDETLDAYETAEELQKRMKESTMLQEHPELQAFFEKMSQQLASGKQVEQLSLDDMPEDAIPAFLYDVGASGVSVFIQMALQSDPQPEDMDGIAALSRARHHILQINTVMA